MMEAVTTAFHCPRCIKPIKRSALEACYAEQEYCSPIEVECGNCGREMEVTVEQVPEFTLVTDHD